MSSKAKEKKMMKELSAVEKKMDMLKQVKVERYEEHISEIDSRIKQLALRSEQVRSSLLDYILDENDEEAFSVEGVGAASLVVRRNVIEVSDEKKAIEFSLSKGLEKKMLSMKLNKAAYKKLAEKMLVEKETALPGINVVDKSHVTVRFEEEA